MTIDKRHLGNPPETQSFERAGLPSQLGSGEWRRFAADPEALLGCPTVKAEEIFSAMPLEQQASLVLLAPWERRQDLILLSSEARVLVQGLPVQELFWTIKAIGPEDSVHLLRLAGPEQIQFIFDLDWWRKAELQPDRVVTWIMLLFEASEDVLAEWLSWLMDHDETLLPEVLRLFLQVKRRPDDVDILEAREISPPFTLDDIYYVQFRRQEWVVLWGRLLEILSEIFPARYRDVMEGLLADSPSENLEMAYRWRSSRLNDWGLPDYFEALEIYAPLPLVRERTGGMREADGTPSEVHLLPAFVPTLYFGEAPILRRAIEALAGTAVMGRITQEWVWVANKILMVDGVDLDDPAALKGSLAKAAASLNLGLEHLCQAEGGSPEGVLASTLLEDIARLAHTLIRDVAKAARDLVRGAYVDPQASYLPDEKSGAFRGLLLDRPLCWDQERGTWRPFRSTEELSRAEAIVSEAGQWSALMALISPPWRQWPHRFRDRLEDLTWPKGLLTALAQYQLGRGLVVHPVPWTALPGLRDAWFPRERHAPAAKGRNGRGISVPEGTVQDLVKALGPVAARAGLGLSQVSLMVEGALRGLAEEWAGLAEGGTMEGDCCTAILTAPG